LAAVSRDPQLAQVVCDGTLRRHLALGKLGKAQNNRQDVVKLMGNATG
jgi:hypothetical protein